MDWLLLPLAGLLIGIVVAAPLGPVNLIVIRRTLAHGLLHGFFVGLGAAVGDGIFAAITAFGMTALGQLIAGYGVGLQIAGALLLLGFGVHTFYSVPQDAPPAERQASGRGARLAAATASTFALTMTNPATMLGFAALFAGLGILAEADTGFIAAATVVLGVLAGSTLWWLTISAITSLIHHQITPKRMRQINQASGVFIGFFGLVVLGHLVWQWVT